MRHILLFIGLLFAGNAIAQSTMDSIVIEFTALPVNHYHINNDGQTSNTTNDNFRLVFIPTRDSTIDGIPSYVQEVHYKRVGVNFRTDTAGIDTIEFRHTDTRTTFRCSAAPSTNTSTTIVVDMDSAQLAQTEFYYAYHDEVHQSGGRYSITSNTSTGDLLPTTRIKITFYKRLPAAVGDDPAAQLSWYPNPASKRITFSAPLGEACTLYDVHGRAMLAAVPGDDGLDVSQLEPGVYFLRFGGKTEKLVIQ